jgi:RNA polymerase sigma factor FliA
MTETAQLSRRARGDDARQNMMSEHLGLVHYIARLVARGQPHTVEFDELLSAGTLGLAAAVDTFDPSRGFAFSTFATPRIRGAILDELRRQDHVPRASRRKMRALKAVSATLGRDGATPTDAEMAAALGIDLETLWRWQTDVESKMHVSLDEHVGDTDSGPTPAEMSGGVTESEVEDEITHAQEVAALRDALLELSEQERTVMSLYYHEDLKLHEIAMALGVSESRASQIRTKALRTLRTKLGRLRGIGE